MTSSSAAYGASRSASVRADEWGGEADKLGHTNVAFLGNAVKTLEECSWVAARVYNWGRAAAAAAAVRFRFLPRACLALAALLKSFTLLFWQKQVCLFHFGGTLSKDKPDEFNRSIKTFLLRIDRIGL